MITTLIQLTQVTYFLGVVAAIIHTPAQAQQTNIKGANPDTSNEVV